MGVDKASLSFGPESMLARVCRLLSAVATPVVVVAQAEQSLPSLDAEWVVARDRAPDRGPLEGLSAGLRTLQALGCQQGLLCAADMPLIEPKVMRQLVDLAAGRAIATLSVDGHAQPLCAVYSVDLLADIEQLVSAGGAGPAALLARDDVLRIDQALFADQMALRRTLCNVNTWEDYQSALRTAGLPAPDELPPSS